MTFIVESITSRVNGYRNDSISFVTTSIEQCKVLENVVLCCGKKSTHFDLIPWDFGIKSITQRVTTGIDYKYHYFEKF